MEERPTFRVVQSLDDLIKAYLVRGIVFVSEQRIGYREEIDEHEHAAVHVLGELGGEPIAAARIRFLGAFAKLERMAVRKEYRRRGYGSALLSFALQVARDHGFTRFKLHAQTSALPFYARHGFQPQGEIFHEVNIEHCLMVKEEE
jgi:predicted GNAT family N-acyltransferase